MKIFSANQMRALDAYTIAHTPIASHTLMEKAATVFYQAFVASAQQAGWEMRKPVLVFCGMGNNGGDGWVIARLAAASGWQVSVYVVHHAASYSADNEYHANLLPSDIAIHNIYQKEDLPVIDGNAVIIDAIFGTGLSRSPEGIAAETIAHINAAAVCVYAVDIASGLFCDAPTTHPFVIRPTFTFTFQLPKLAFLLPENEAYTGKWKVLPIGLSEEGMNQMQTPYHYIDAACVQALLRPKSHFSHKGTNGHIGLFAGSYGKIGAAVLCTQSALRSGAGLVTACIPHCGYDVLQISAPEAMVINGGENTLSFLPDCSFFSPFQAVGVGPGIGKSKETRAFFTQLLTHIPATCGCVIDADGLNLLAENTDLHTLIPKNTILTPHVKEFARLVGETTSSFEQIAKGQAWAHQHQCFLLLKRAHTLIFTPDGEIFFNSTGNPGMAKGGSGDVLTGIITALLGQGYSPLSACIIGVYIHGCAGDIAADTLSMTAMKAGDIVQNLPNAWKLLAT